MVGSRVRLEVVSGRRAFRGLTPRWDLSAFEGSNNTIVSKLKHVFNTIQRAVKASCDRAVMWIGLGVKKRVMLWLCSSAKLLSYRSPILLYRGSSEFGTVEGGKGSEFWYGWGAENLYRV